MKKGFKVGTIILIVLCFIGLCLLLYPTVADFRNRNFTTRVISDYVKMTENITKEDFEAIWKEAGECNKELLERPNRFSLTYEVGRIRSVLPEDVYSLGINGAGTQEEWRISQAPSEHTSSRTA